MSRALNELLSHVLSVVRVMSRFIDETEIQPDDLVIDINDLINPSFDDVFDSEIENIALKGGRASTKSSVISLKLVTGFIEDDNANAAIFRKVANTLETSVYEQIKWAIYELHLESEFKFRTSPYRIIHKETGTAFYFYGLDDPMKLKSQKIAKGYVRWMWFEELAEFKNKEEIDTVRFSYTRAKIPDGKVVQSIYSWNPPKNPYEWVNEWTDERIGRKDFMIHHSTYLDDVQGFLSQQYLDEIENYKANDYDYYRWMFLGEVIGMGDNVYNMNLFKPITELFDDDRIIYLYYAIDGGHMVSATTALCFGLTAKGKVILLDTYYYSPAGKTVKKAPDDLAKDINEFIKRTSRDSRWSSATIRRRTIDSAEGGIRNQYFKDYGQRLSPVVKKKKPVMIDYVHDLLAQGRFYYLNIEENKIFVEEHKMYRWDEKTIKRGNPEVIKEDDHTCDAFQYFAVDNARDLKLKV